MLTFFFTATLLKGALSMQQNHVASGALRTTHHKISTRFMSHALVKFTPTGFSYSLLLLTTASCFSARLLPDTWIALASSTRPEQ